ncbi:MAG TPA: 4Fe-4S dicluster domain-containing protein, partial [Phycisphaerae bacterium]
SVLLKLLARSATAQPLTCYTQIITGPRRAAEHDGPDEVHVILVDNGRTEILRQETRELLRCIRCGACLNACPVYRKIGGHSYGSVYSGPIGAVITPLMKGLANYPDLPHASSLCGACYAACPVNIDIPSHLIRLREQMVTRRITNLPERLFYRVWALSLRSSASYRVATSVQRLLLRLTARWTGSQDRGDPYAARGWLTRLPPPLNGWTDERDMPTPTARTFRHWWRRRQKEREG